MIAPAPSPREDRPAALCDTRTEFDVRGMDCQNCVRHVREALQSLEGVDSVSVNLESHRATVQWRRGAVPDVSAATRAIAEAGYEPTAIAAGAPSAEGRASIWSGWTGNLVVGIPVTVVLMLGEWGFGLAMQPWFRWLAFALATVVQGVAGRRFYVGAWRQLKARSSNMDTLVSLGSTAAYGYSLWALFHGTHVFFMEAASIITLVSVGHWIEARMSARAAGSMKKLLSLAPDVARRRAADGTEEMVPVSALHHGDLVVLRAGERVPTDGAVVEGTSSVDESMLTGESMPLDKAPGSPVYGGTANLSSRLVVRVEALGEETALAQIIAVVDRAQNSRAAIQRLGDRVSSVFVPIVVLIALATAAWWGFAPGPAHHTLTLLSPYLWPVHLADTALALAIIQAAGVLIVACPCAMGLATPAAIMAGTNAAAERGILIRDGIALEKAGTITSVVFDKTGTLTHGHPEVTQTERFATEGRPDPVALAAALARHSNHPLSQAIAGAAGAPVEVSNWREVGGSGVEGTLDAREIRLGSLRWLAESGVDVSAGLDIAGGWDGASSVGFAIQSKLAALFRLEDTLKPDAAVIVRQLQQAGHQVYLLSGDNRATAEKIGMSLGIDREHIAAEVRPGEKAAFVADLQRKGQRVAFVGDGINDAPALEQADLGIAVGRASDVAKMAADIVLLKSNIHAIPQSLGIAAATLRVIRQNLFWAFFYNAAAIPLAALGFLSPVICALTMGLSDVVVIGNALRLRRWRG